MNFQINDFVVSSAGWEIEVDSTLPKDAAISALLIAFKNFKENLNISTIIMVNTKEDHKRDRVIDASFFPTYEILKEIGFNKASNGFNFYNKTINEIKHIKKQSDS